LPRFRAPPELTSVPVSHFLASCYWLSLLTRALVLSDFDWATSLRLFRAPCSGMWYTTCRMFALVGARVKENREERGAENAPLAPQRE
jgi:hypothetical protein